VPLPANGSQTKPTLISRSRFITSTGCWATCSFPRGDPQANTPAWPPLSFRGTRPFLKPGKIAVKVISHYGDEVLKVYPG